MLIVDVHFVESNIARKKPLAFSMKCDGHGYGYGYGYGRVIG